MMPAEQISQPAAEPRLRTMPQPDAYTSPWPTSVRIRIALWDIVWSLAFRTTPKPCAPWRRFLLRLFGARVSGKPFISASARIKMPWNLDIRDRACISPGAEVYNLGPCVIHERANITQYAYLCGGSHDLSDPALPLVVGRIEIGADAFLGARCVILPGVFVGEGAVVGAGAVAAKDVPPWTIVVGNPARALRKRTHPRSAGAGA